jgi:hypothetical protein
MMTDSSKYIDELKKGFTGAVTMGELNGPSLGGAQFTNEFRDYAKSMGYEIDRGLSPMDGPSFLVRPEGWTPDAFNAHIKTQEETAATAKTAAAVKAAEDKAVADGLATKPPLQQKRHVRARLKNLRMHCQQAKACTESFKTSTARLKKNTQG